MLKHHDLYQPGFHQNRYPAIIWQRNPLLLNPKEFSGLLLRLKTACVFTSLDFVIEPLAEGEASVQQRLKTQLRKLHCV